MDITSGVQTSNNCSVVSIACNREQPAKNQCRGQSVGTQPVIPPRYGEVTRPTRQPPPPAELVQRLRVALPGWTFEAGRPDGVGAVVATVPLPIGDERCRTSAWEGFRLGIHTMIAIVAFYGSPVAAANFADFFTIISRWAEAEE